MRDDAPGAVSEGIGPWLDHLASSCMSSQGDTLEQSELWGLLDSLPVAILISTDRDCRRIRGNAAARRIYRLSEHENFSVTAPDEELPNLAIYSDGVLADPKNLPMQVAARTGRAVPKSECEIRFPDGSRIFIAGHTIPLRNEAGEVCGSVGAFVDLTSQKDEVEFANVRSDEMAHRLKNTIAMVQAISRRTVLPLIGEDAYRTYEERLTALGNVQSLTSKNNWTGAPLTDIVEMTIFAVARAIRHRISIEGPPVALAVDATVAVSMVLHELSTNACKYGALSDAKGKLRITWEATPSGDSIQVGLTWLEFDGPMVAPPKSEGFGTAMMNAVCQRLKDGHLHLDFDAAGLRAQLRFRVKRPEA